MTRARRVGAILAIAAMAIALRAWRLSWGIAQGDVFLDEATIWGLRGLRFVPLTVDSFWTDRLFYPTLNLYLIGLATWLGHSLGLTTSPRPDIFDVIAVGRVVSMLASTATVALVGLLAARLYSRRAGLVAAALMAVVPFELMQSHYASLEPLLSAMGVLTVLASWEVVRRDRVGWLALAGAMAGLATATKYPGMVLLAAPGWAAAELAWRRRSAWPLVGGGALALGSAAVAFAVACPPCVLMPGQVSAWVGGLAAQPLDHPNYIGNHVPAPGLGWYGRRVAYQLVASLPYMLGWPLYLSALVAVAAAVRRRQPADRLLLVTLLATFASVAGLWITFPRYLLPAVPSLVVLTARGFAGATGWSRRRAVAAAAVGLYTLALAASQARRFSFDQQRELAAWLAPRLGAGAPGGEPPRVVVPDQLGVFTGLGGPLLDAGMQPDWRPPGAWFTGDPAVVVLPHFARNSIRRDQPPGSTLAADLDRLESGAAGYRAVRTWRSGYLQDGFYTWLDPVFEGDLWQGESGFTVYWRVSDPPLPGAGAWGEDEAK